MTRSSARNLLFLAALPLVLSLGCSTHKERILGNDRLARGPGGLGTTVREISAPDRDTYVSPGAANLGQTLIVGIAPSFEAKAFFRRPAAWGLPDTSHQGVAVLSVAFEAPIDVDASNNGAGLAVSLATIATEYDPTAPWPGPAAALTLGSLSDASVAPFRIELTGNVIPLMEAWAADSLSFPGMVLTPTGGNGLIGLQADKATITVVYSRDVGSGVRDTISVVTAFGNDHYLHSPRTPLPTGGETLLVLGGLHELGVSMRFPAMSVPGGSTVNEATIRLHVDPSSPFFTSGQKAPLVVRRIRTAWTESVTDTAGLEVDAAAYAASDSVAVTSGADSVLTVALPQSIIREWTAAGAINEGILITLPNANRLPEIWFGSRESTTPAELRVSTTSPPPGKF
jgi:hypothetical protein